MKRASDISVKSVAVHWLPIETRMPIKFGTECVTEVTCARVRIGVAGRNGDVAYGWGETPLSVQWMWPGSMSYDSRLAVAKNFCKALAAAWLRADFKGHSLEIGRHLLDEVLPPLWRDFNSVLPSGEEKMPWLAAIVCCSAFDIAVHDAFGNLHNRPTFSTFNADYVSDLQHFIQPVAGSNVSFADRYPENELAKKPKERMIVWHLVGATDPLDEKDLDASAPDDGYPVLLSDWIRRDGLRCLKIKLCGKDAQWDVDRIIRVFTVASACNVEWLSLDFNCTVVEPGYVNGILDLLLAEHPNCFRMILYVEQPFPYDLERHQIDVRSTSARKPLFLDESAHDWRMVRLGRELGWSGVALKTCKTLTGAILMQCWARAHGMPLMVQDLANPMLALVSHAVLAAHSETIMGVEVNSVQFYPDASNPEASVHPGLFTRRNGMVSLGSIGKTGLGYRVNEIDRLLPKPEIELGEL